MNLDVKLTLELTPQLKSHDWVFQSFYSSPSSSSSFSAALEESSSSSYCRDWQLSLSVHFPRNYSFFKEMWFSFHSSEFISFEWIWIHLHSPRWLSPWWRSGWRRHLPSKSFEIGPRHLNSSFFLFFKKRTLLKTWSPNTLHRLNATKTFIEWWFDWNSSVIRAPARGVQCPAGLSVDVPLQRRHRRLPRQVADENPRLSAGKCHRIVSRPPTITPFQLQHKCLWHGIMKSREFSGKPTGCRPLFNHHSSLYNTVI